MTGGRQITSSFLTSTSNMQVTSTSNMQESVVLQGIPVRPEVLSQVYESPNFFSGSVWIPGEISDPAAISALSNLNKFLIIQRYEFFNGVVQGEYIHFLQREVSAAVTSPDLLAAKLTYILTREYTSWYSYANSIGMSVPKHDWYINNFGSLIPSPNEPLYCEPYYVILLLMIIMVAILSIIFRRNIIKKSWLSFGTSMSTHHILGLKKVPRVRLFADSSGT